MKYLLVVLLMALGELYCCSTSRAQSSDPASRWQVFPVSPLLLDRSGLQPDSMALTQAINSASERLARFQPATSAQAWHARRPEVEAAFLRCLGLAKMPERSPLNARTIDRLPFSHHDLEKVVFESRPGFVVTCHVYLPKATAGESASVKRPAILCPIGHYLSAGKSSEVVQARCVQLARMGFVVLTYDAIGQGERLTGENVHHDAGYTLLPIGETIAGWMVWDSIRAVDYLCTRDDVDASRIGMTGNSGGGLNTLFTAAIEPRIQAAVVVGFTFEFRHWLKYAGTHCTCTHLPGWLSEMEWFELASLIAPRPLMLIQGEADSIFPIVGARRAADDTSKIYQLLDAQSHFRFVELAGQPHAYSQPFREPMYAWFARHLRDREADANGERSFTSADTIAEYPAELLSETDSRLKCFTAAEFAGQSRSVVSLAVDAARVLASKRQAMSPTSLPDLKAEIKKYVRPDTSINHLLSKVHAEQNETTVSQQKLSFVSEDGIALPALLWQPARDVNNKTVLVVADSHGKSAVAEAPWRESLNRQGYAVLAVDLRNRGETLSRYRPGYDSNFRLLYCHLLQGQPLPYRRAFDFTRAIDFVASRDELKVHRVVAIGIGDDALSVLLASIADERISQVILADYYASFVAQMAARQLPEPMGSHWNDPQLTGCIEAAGKTIDFASVLPGILHRADMAELIAAVAPRPVLFCQARAAREHDATTDALTAQMIIQFIMRL